MDVSGVGQSPAGFSAVPETALDPQRPSQAGGPEKLGQARQAPLDLLSNERLGRELVSLGLRPDAAKLLAARALMMLQGSLDLTTLLDVDRSLQGMTSPDQPEAEAAAFLVTRQLPANPETVSWVLGRQNATEPAGMRMIQLIQRFQAAMAARSETPVAPPRGDASATPMPPSATPMPPSATPPQPPAPSAPGTPSPGPQAAAPATPGLPAAPSSPVPTSPAAPVPAAGVPAGSVPPPAPAAPPASEAEAPIPQGALPQAPETAQAPAEKPVATPASSAPSPAAPAPPTASAPAASPTPQPAAAAPAIATVATALAETALAPATSEASPAATPQPGAQAPESPERELFAKLQALALPEGKAKEVASALRRLVQALRPQEADLARGEVAAAKERLSTVAARAIAHAPEDPTVREAHDEIRFQQVQSVRHEGQTPHEFIIPVWWKGGSGEIRVQERPKGAARRSEEASAPTRVVMALDTPHLGAIRIDLLLSQRQVNCLVAAQDQGAADFLSARLTELRSAIEETGIRVNALGMKPFTADAAALGPGDAKGVDFYG